MILQVIFFDIVKWMVLEFDFQCGTVQVEDILQLYIFNIGEFDIFFIDFLEEGSISIQNYWSIWKKFYGFSNWSKIVIVIFGNEVVFFLEIVSDYVKDEKFCFYGFKCVVVGYEWNFIFEEVNLYKFFDFFNVINLEQYFKLFLKYWLY